MGQEKLSSIAMMTIERKYCNQMLEYDIDMIIDVFGKNRNFPFFKLTNNCLVSFRLIHSGDSSPEHLGGTETFGGLGAKPGGKFQRPRPFDLRETPFLLQR